MLEDRGGPTLRRLQAKIPPAAAFQIMEVEEELKDMNTILQNDPPENHEHALFLSVKGLLPGSRVRWAREMEDAFSKFHHTRAVTSKTGPP